MEDKRQFKRITYYLGQDSKQQIEGATIAWPNGELSYLLDLSAQGAAISFPLNFSIEQHKAYDLKLTLGEIEGFNVKAEVRWFNSKVVGVQFVSLSQFARTHFDEFINDKVIGANLYLVSKEFYSKENTPDFWFHGPQETNVYVWLSNNELNKLIFEIDGQTLTYEDQKITITKQASEFEAKDKYSEEDDAVAVNTSLLARQSIYARALGVLSQLEPIKPYLSNLFLLLRRP